MTEALKTRRAPEVSYHEIKLPLTSLHYTETGEGPPLIMVPATISELDNWTAVTQFMGQRFRVHFFELPGHGRSRPFAQPYSSELVAQTVEDFIDAMGYEKITLMGFSFGGILTMKTLEQLGRRVERVVLISPCMTQRALQLPPSRVKALRGIIKTVGRPGVLSGLVRMLHSERLGSYAARGLRRIGDVEESIPLEARLKQMPEYTFQVLVRQVIEVLSIDFGKRQSPFEMPCYFAMSIHDPILDFDTTLAVVEKNFEQVYVERFTFPYHQWPEAPTFAGLVRDYGHFLEQIV